jgi:protein associated with RNAse G/E
MESRMEVESSEVAAAQGSIVTVHALKFDGRVHREWQAKLVRQVGSLVVVEGVFAAEIRHAQLGTIAAGTLSAEYYWTDRWYSVFRFREPAGALRNYYCNINQPATFDGALLTFVDLDIDVLVAPDFSSRILDEEEFAVNAEAYGYPPLVRESARCALAELLEHISRREHPFDGQV